CAPERRLGHAPPPRAREIAIAHRLRRRYVVRASYAAAVDRPLDRPKHVLPVDPRHPLTAAADRAARAEAERKHHLLERSPVALEHHAETEDDHSRHRVTLMRRRFPLPRNFGEKASAVVRGFIEDLVAARTVEADG